ncbi:MAG: 7-cyano-7-deazaguanine synthase [archaeon]|nr:MAG: 7-cyano-7-deazaguanine synthase [archaeon]
MPSLKGLGRKARRRTSGTRKAIVLLSGGIDSATCLYLLRREHDVRAITFEYRGIVASELASARAIAAHAGVREHRVVRLPDLREAADIGAEKFPGRPPSYIPARNAVFYGLAASFAEEVGAVVVAGGHHKEDAVRFPDASPAFFSALERALLVGTPALRRRGMRIVLPLRTLSKSQVLRRASREGVPLQLTWSCHRDGRLHCWKCEGCLWRVRSFREAGVSDPLLGLQGNMQGPESRPKHRASP